MRSLPRAPYVIRRLQFSCSCGRVGCREYRAKGNSAISFYHGLRLQISLLQLPIRDNIAVQTVSTLVSVY